MYNVETISKACPHAFYELYYTALGITNITIQQFIFLTEDKIQLNLYRDS